MKEDISAKYHWRGEPLIFDLIVYSIIKIQNSKKIHVLPGETLVEIVRPILKICNAEVPEEKKHLFCLVFA